MIFEEGLVLWILFPHSSIPVLKFILSFLNICFKLQDFTPSSKIKKLSNVKYYYRWKAIFFIYIFLLYFWKPLMLFITEACGRGVRTNPPTPQLGDENTQNFRFFLKWTNNTSPCQSTSVLLDVFLQRWYAIGSR